MLYEPKPTPAVPEPAFARPTISMRNAGRNTTDQRSQPKNEHGDETGAALQSEDTERECGDDSGQSSTHPVPRLSVSTSF